ncbi:unnamed protein product [Microthlaspi erraticum]|uniref:Glucose-methanol-choline oxidoreductase N-terminal domain-containing protein n=1 Tax=Microthlaspi erraticum TaxID=1685480 RepID=A0A6D2KES4_9BRAS|nr:unnamed protein product [Microthlaspi erraticum]
MGLHIFRLLCKILVATILFHGSCYSDKDGQYTFMKDAIVAPTYASFDYIVIGGGTSGCALATTLSQNASVLVLERGGSPYDNLTATDLGNVIPSSWSQPFTSKDGVDNQRARVLGGGTVINGGFYTRAGDDYVAEAKWEMEDVESAYEWIEKKLVFKPQVKGWQSAYLKGLLEADVTPYNGFTYEHINGTKIGGTLFDIGGHRHSAADLLKYANPDKIVVYLNATVHKILFTTKGDQKLKAHGVIYKDRDGVFHKAELAENVMNEVILSAGALGSPQLLMLSGVGPRAHLEAHGVNPVVRDHPMVGKGMGDNPMSGVVIPSPLPVEMVPPANVGITKFGSFVEGAALDSLSQTPSIKSNSGLIVEKVDGPVSRGYLELQNTNPDDNPSVKFNYYQEHEDLEKCVIGLETIIKVIDSKAFSKYKYPNATAIELLSLMLSPQTAVSNLTQYCIDTVRTIFHYHGGCQVGRVVDKNYKVFGIDSLRVIDGSTFLKSPGTNPQATVLMLGRYMGQKIIQDRVSFGGK